MLGGPGGPFTIIFNGAWAGVSGLQIVNGAQNTTTNTFATTGPAISATTDLAPNDIIAVNDQTPVNPSFNTEVQRLTFANTTGGTFRLSEHRGKVVMINFWATWCPPCLEEMPALERLHRQHKGTGFTLMAVSVDTDPAKVKPFLTSHKLTFPVGLDPRMDIANAYGVRALPSSFIVGRDGTLAALAIGPRHWDSNAAHALIEGMAR